MDASTSQALLRHARTNVLIINPEAPLPAAASIAAAGLPQLLS
jgi:hypothetical protein